MRPGHPALVSLVGHVIYGCWSCGDRPTRLKACGVFVSVPVCLCVDVEVLHMRLW